MNLVPIKLTAAGAAAIALLAGGLLLAVGPDRAVPAGSLPQPVRGTAEPLPAPNIVTVVVDDMPESMLSPEIMPQTFARLPEATRFDDFIATTPLCCPFRATLLTGQYAHNNGVLRNDYALLRKPHNVLPVWLSKAGYNTAHVGKFMNGYDRELGRGKVAPGWGSWFTQIRPKLYYNWKAYDGKRVHRYGEDNSDHLTPVVGHVATKMVRRLSQKNKPFYLQTDFLAPHIGSGRDKRCLRAGVPQPRDEGRFDGLPLPEPESFNELDVSDKPARIAARGQLDASKLASMAAKYRCTAEAVYSADRQIGRLFAKIEASGEADRTVIIFVSDNGFFRGEHRIPGGKAEPYEENLSLPLAMWVPEAYRAAGPHLTNVAAPAASIDLAPTIIDLAGAAPCRNAKQGSCRTLDGRSLMPLVRGEEGVFPEVRSLVVELKDCTYRGLRRDGQIFFAYGESKGSGACRITDREHYNLIEDPAQMDNLFPADPGTVRDDQDFLRAELKRLHDCRGIEGRDEPFRDRTFCE